MDNKTTYPVLVFLHPNNSWTYIASCPLHRHFFLVDCDTRWNLTLDSGVLCMSCYV